MDERLSSGLIVASSAALSIADIDQRFVMRLMGAEN
jgi:hypothetical protein